MTTVGFRRPTLAALTVYCLLLNALAPSWALAAGTSPRPALPRPALPRPALPRPALPLAPAALLSPALPAAPAPDARASRVPLARVVRQYQDRVTEAQAVLRLWDARRAAGEDATAEAQLLAAAAAALRDAAATLEQRFARIEQALATSGTPAQRAAFADAVRAFRGGDAAARADLPRLAAAATPAEAVDAAARLRLLLPRAATRTDTLWSAGSAGPAIPRGGGAQAAALDPSAPIDFHTTAPPRESTLQPAYMGGDPGTEGNLDPTPDVQLTPEIQALAADLGHSAARIYEWVRNATTFQPYFGSLKGSQAALDTLAGNDYDLSSLTIALLRASNIPARYVRGTVKTSTARAMNWLGVRSPHAVGYLLAAAGIDAAGYDTDADGTPNYFEIDRCWVQAQVAHSDYRGVDGSRGGKAWVPLDPAFKLSRYQPGIAGLPQQVPFDEAGYLAQRTPLLAYQWYEDQVRAYLAAHLPGRSLADVPYRGTIAAESLGLLPASLPHEAVAFTGDWDALPEALRHRTQITLFGPVGQVLLDRTLRDPEIAEKRVTLSYATAKSGDDLANQLGGADEVPALLATLTPQLKLDGSVDTTGTTVSTGAGVTIRVRFLFPNDDPVEEVTHVRYAGDYHALALDLQQVGATLMDKKARALLDANTKRGTPNEDRDALEGGLLDLAGLRYWQRLGTGETSLDGIFQFRTVKQLYEVLVTANTDVLYLYDRPFAVTPGNLNVDAKRGAKSLVSIDADDSQRNALFKLNGRDGSAQEHAVWEETVHEDSVSTIKALQFANETDINHDGTANHGDVLDITTVGGLSALCPAFPSGARSSMQNALSLGKVVKTPQCDFVYNQWHGVGWIEEDPGLGSGAYLISGYLAGGATSTRRADAANAWLPLGRAAFEDLARCAASQGVATLSLSEPRDLGRLAVRDDLRRRVREELAAGRSVRALAAPATCGGAERFAFLVEETGLGLEALIGDGGSGSENPPQPIDNPEKPGPSRLVLCPPTVGQPVSLANGNMYHQFRDVSIDGVGPPLVFVRTYNSQVDRLGPMGWGWSHTWDVYLTEDPGIAVTVYEGSGRATRYTDTGGGTYASPPGVHETLATDGAGWKLTFVDGAVWSFASDKKLHSVRDTFSNTVTLGYDGGGKLTTVTDALSRALTIAYGADGRIDSVTDWTGRTWSFNHDATGNLISSTTPADAETPAATTTYGYLATSYLPHDLAWIQFPGSYRIDFEYYTNDKLYRHTESGRRTYAYAYQPLAALTTVTDPRGNDTLYRFTPSGAVESVEGPDGSIVRYEYDAGGNVVRIVNRGGYESTTTWDGRGRPLTATDPLSHTTTFTYATNFPKASTITDRNGFVTVADVDAGTGAVTRIEDPEHGVTRFTYDSRGRVETMIDPRGQTTRFYYHAASGQLNRLEKPMGIVWQFGLDALGRRTSTIDPESRTTQFRFDVLGRIKEARDPLSRNENYRYDALGQLLERTSRDGTTVRYDYDDLRQLVRITDPGGRAVEYEYDDPGCGCGTEDAITAITVPGGGRYEIGRDTRGRPIRLTAPDGAVTLRTWDAMGRLTEEIRPDGSRIAYEYDALGRLTEADPGSGIPSTYVYDNEGWLTQAANGVTTQTFEYDQAGRLERVDDSLTGKTLRYGYDAAGLRTSFTDGEGIVWSYGFDNAMRLTSQTDFAGKTWNFTRDGLARATRVDFPNGQVLTRGFDAAGALTALQVTRTGATAIDRTYTPDGVGRVTHEHDAVHGDSDYAYDLSGRLVAAQRIGRPDEFYSLDDAGNRLGDASGLDLVYDAGDRLVRRGSTSLVYDGRGNLLEERAPTGTTRFSYTWNDRVATADLPGGRHIEYRYDPFGYRIESTIDGQVTRVLRDGGEVLARYDGAGALQAKYVLSRGVGYPLAVTRGATRSYLHQDPRGSTVAVTDAAGAVSARVVYDAFGHVVDKTAAWTDPVLFLGRDYDADLALYDVQARHYDPRSGRFLQRDPLGLGGGDSNVYNYAASDPVNNVDRDGQVIWFVIAGAAVLVTAGTVYYIGMEKGNNVNVYQGKMDKTWGKYIADPVNADCPDYQVQKDAIVVSYKDVEMIPGTAFNGPPAVSADDLKQTVLMSAPSTADQVTQGGLEGFVDNFTKKMDERPKAYTVYGIYDYLKSLFVY